jgi:hypothetical protein
MLSFHADAVIKARYLERLAGHADADEIIKGRYWEAGKGCAVGCTIHGDAHEDFERELGIPRMLAWLEDVIFEGLPNRAAKTWPERFLSSIEPGRNLTPVGWQFLHWLVTDSGFGGSALPSGAMQDAVRRCAELLLPLVEGRPADKAAAEQAAALGWAAIETAATDRMEAEPGGTPHRQTPWIVESASLAAESAALSVTSLTLSAERAATALSAAVARSADYAIVSEKLLSLLEAA